MLLRLLAAALVWSIVAAPAALALPFVRVSAGSAETGAGGNSSGVDLSSSNRVWGRAYASSEEYLYFGTGPRDCNSDPISCAASLPSQSGRGNAFAEANGDNGTLKASAVAGENSAAGATARARLTDTITLADDIIEIDLDVNKLGGNAGGNWNGEISVRVYIPGTHPESDPDIDLFRLEALRDAQNSYVSYGQLMPDQGEESFTANELFSIPGGISFDLDLGLFSWVEGEPGPLVPPFPGFPVGSPAIGSTLTLVFELIADVDCVSNDCEVFAIADNTLHIGLDGTSASGYSYPGLAIDGGGDGDGGGGGDDGGEVPEPGSLPLLIATLVAAAMRGSRACVAKR